MSTTQQENPPKLNDEKQAEQDAHRDPLSGRAGAHPVGTGLGAAAGGTTGAVVAGAMVGTIAGPVGTVAGAAVGAVVGAVAGGLTGKAVAEEVNPTAEHGYWRQQFSSRTYVPSGRSYDEYAVAYQYGWESPTRHPGKSFEESEPLLRRDWDRFKGASRLGWQEVKEAARDSWARVSKPRTVITE